MKNIIHGPYVLQRTYRKVKSKLAESETAYRLLELDVKNLKIALDGYYQTHNHHCRCDCGFCSHARALVRYPYKASLKEIEEEAKTIPIFRIRDST